jgi:hypothetical protein
MSEPLGYVSVDRITLQRATEAREADLCSTVVRHAKVETAADRARRLQRRPVGNVLVYKRGER